MRVFIAIELPENIKNYLKDLQKSLTDIKASFVKEFHLTLKFLGEVSDEDIENIKEALSKIKPEKFSVNLSKLGFFSNEDYIRVVWAGLEPEKKVLDLQKKIDLSMESFGFRREKDFKSHLTLARVKFIENKKEFVEKIKSLEIKPFGFEVSSFSLIKSTLTRDGPIYEELAKFYP